MIVEAIVQALKLCVLTIGYALKMADEHRAAVEAAQARATLFEKALAAALMQLRLDTVLEKRKVDAVDDKIDEESKKR